MSTVQLQGTLQADDLLYPLLDGYFESPDEELYYDDIALMGLTIGQQVSLTLESEFTGELEIFSSNDFRQNLGSQTTFIVESEGDYVVRVTSFNPREIGAYTLTTSAGTLEPVPPYQAEALVQEGQYRWQNRPLGKRVTLTYSFMEELPSYYRPNRKGQWEGNTAGNFKPMTQPQREAVELALQEWEKVSGIKFREVSDRNSVQLRFGAAEDLDRNNPSFGWAYYPSEGRFIGGDMWLNHKDPSNRNPVPGSLGFSTILHEIGHALGLSHPFDELFTLPKAQSTIQYTVMAYDKHPHLPEKYQPDAPMLYDIAAIQQLYGRNPKTNRGNTVYRWQLGETFIETIYDTGGTDTVNARNQRQDVVINLGAGQFSSIGSFRRKPIKDNVAIAFGVTLENAIGGAGNDTLIGNEGSNQLTGSSGADVLIGLAGNDQLTGGAGDDTFVFQTENDGVDTITDFAQGNDTIDVSPLLTQVGYAGADPLLEGILTASVQQGSIAVLFDRDGVGGNAPAAALAILENFTDVQALNNSIKFVS
ncbi:MAG: M10 family metallopeptidase C-terminal domain-containing protein [Synechococcales bacterium]|nr:M10 family metallopeptidase C-terminal domain-containing protein [Synechococcales bacterium]